MKAYKETKLTNDAVFPVEVFLADNQIENLSVPPHWHECVEVLMYIEGGATQQIDDKIFQVKANDVVIVNMGVIHSTYCEDNQCCKVLVLKFMPQLVDNSVSFVDSKYVHLFLSKNKSDNFLLENISLENTGLFGLFSKILSEDTLQLTAYELVIKGAIYQIIGLLIRNGNIAGVNRDIDDGLYQEIKPVLSYIEDNYMKDFDMGQMAALINMSYYHFSRTFKNIVGRTFKEFVECVRIAEADKLIVGTNLNITQIAFEVGYNNVASFNRVYKRVKNITPTQMRQFKQKVEK